MYRRVSYGKNQMEFECVFKVRKRVSELWSVTPNQREFKGMRVSEIFHKREKPHCKLTLNFFFFLGCS